MFKIFCFQSLVWSCWFIILILILIRFHLHRTRDQRHGCQTSFIERPPASATTSKSCFGRVSRRAEQGTKLKMTYARTLTSNSRVDLWIKRCPENNEFPNATYHTSSCSGAIIKGPQKIAYCVRCRRNTGYPARNARTSCQISGQVFPETPPKKRWRVRTSQRISKGTKLLVTKKKT